MMTVRGLENVPPCPFCESQKLDYDYDRLIYVRCQDCDGSGPGGETYKEAKEKWSNRINKTMPIDAIRKTRG